MRELRCEVILLELFSGAPTKPMVLSRAPYRTSVEQTERAVTTTLSTLLDAAKRYRPSEAEREEQRRSFAYGNTAFENPLITRQMVDEEAEKLTTEQTRSNDRDG